MYIIVHGHGLFIKSQVIYSFEDNAHAHYRSKNYKKCFILQLIKNHSSRKPYGLPIEIQISNPIRCDITTHWVKEYDFLAVQNYE